MKVKELIKLLEQCNPEWEICYTSNANPDDEFVDIEEVNELSENQTYLLF